MLEENRVGSKIRQVREAQDMTVEELAEIFGTPVSSEEVILARLIESKLEEKNIVKDQINYNDYARKAGYD